MKIQKYFDQKLLVKIFQSIESTSKAKIKVAKKRAGPLKNKKIKK